MKRQDSGFQITQESSRLSLLARAGKKGSACSAGIKDSADSVGAPGDTKGEFQMVFGPGRNVLGLQEKPDDPGDPQGTHWEGYLPRPDQKLTFYTKLDPRPRAVNFPSQVSQAVFAAAKPNISALSRPRTGLALPSPTPTHL